MKLQRYLAALLAVCAVIGLLYGLDARRKLVGRQAVAVADRPAARLTSARDSSLAPSPATHDPRREVPVRPHVIFVLDLPSTLSPYVAEVEVQCTVVSQHVAHLTQLPPVRLSSGESATVVVPDDVPGDELQWTLQDSVRFSALSGSVSVRAGEGAVRQCWIRPIANPMARGTVIGLEGGPLACATVSFPDLGIVAPVASDGTFALGPVGVSRDSIGLLISPTVELGPSRGRALVASQFVLSDATNWKDIIVVGAQPATIIVRDNRSEPRSEPPQLFASTDLARWFRGVTPGDRSAWLTGTFGWGAAIRPPPVAGERIADGWVFESVPSQVGLVVVVGGTTPRRYDRVLNGVLTADSVAPDLVLTPGESRIVSIQTSPIIRGDVVDAGGNGIQDAEIVVEIGASTFSTFSLDDGSFSVALPPTVDEDDVILVIALAFPRDGGARRSPISSRYTFQQISEVLAGPYYELASTRVRLQLRDSLTIVGRLIDASGSPVPHRRITAARCASIDADWIPQPLSSAYDLTDEAGRYCLGALAGGPYDIAVWPASLGHGGPSVMIESVPAGTDLGDTIAPALDPASVDILIDGVPDLVSDAQLWIFSSAVLRGQDVSSDNPLSVVLGSRLPRRATSTPSLGVGAGVAARPLSVKHVMPGSYSRTGVQLLPGSYAAMLLGYTDGMALPPFVLGPFRVEHGGPPVRLMVPQHARVRLINSGESDSEGEFRTAEGRTIDIADRAGDVASRVRVAAGGYVDVFVPVAAEVHFYEHAAQGLRLRGRVAPPRTTLQVGP